MLVLLPLPLRGREQRALQEKKKHFPGHNHPPRKGEDVDQGLDLHQHHLRRRHHRRRRRRILDLLQERQTEIVMAVKV